MMQIISFPLALSTTRPSLQLSQSLQCHPVHFTLKKQAWLTWHEISSNLTFSTQKGRSAASHLLHPYRAKSPQWEKKTYLGGLGSDYNQCRRKEGRPCQGDWISVIRPLPSGCQIKAGCLTLEPIVNACVRWVFFFFIGSAVYMLLQLFISVCCRLPSMLWWTCGTRSRSKCTAVAWASLCLPSFPTSSEERASSRWGQSSHLALL